MREKLWTGKYILALLTMFGIYIVSNILLSAVTLFAKDLTGNDTYAGLMTSIFTLGALAVRFLVGGLAVRGRVDNQRVVLLGLGIMILGSALLINCGNILLASVARGLQGVGFGLSATATSTLIATICRPSRLLDGISYMAVAQSLTAVIGPSLGYIIIGPAYNRFNLLFICVIGIMVGLMWMLFLKRNNTGKSEATAVREREDNPKVSWMILGIPLFVLLLNAMTQSAIVSFLALYARSLNFAGVGSFFSVNALGMIASRFIMNRLVRRYGEFQMILMSTIVFAISVFFLTRVTSILQMLALAFPAGFAMGSVSPIVNTNLIQSVSKHRISLANALFLSTLDIGYCLGSVVWGLTAARNGYAHVFFIAALLQIIAAAGLFISLNGRLLKFR